MGDLQATIEFSVELYKFFNVDLFQRGLYQVRCVLRVSPRLPVQIETTIPETTANGQPAVQPIILNGDANCSNGSTIGSSRRIESNGSGGGNISMSNGNSIDSIEAELRDQQQQQHHHQPTDIPPLPNNVHNLSSASIINGAGASRVFQILYRNEEVTLRDVIYFRTHLLENLQFAHEFEIKNKIKFRNESVKTKKRQTVRDY